MGNINIQNENKSMPTKQKTRGLTSPWVYDVDRFINDFYNIFETPRHITKDLENLVINPSVDVIENDESFKIEAEMPGIDESDIIIATNDGSLTIKAEKRIAKDDMNKNYVSREIGYGSYERSFVLPNSVDVEKITATFKDNILWINIPKKAESSQKSKKIKVEKINAPSKDTKQASE